MASNIISIASSIGSGFVSDYKNFKKSTTNLIMALFRLHHRSLQAAQILRLTGLVFLGLVLVKFLCYQSNSIALSAFSELILFDVLFLLVALVSIWVRQKSADTTTYPFGYERFEVVAVFASTILAILSSFYLLKEAIERLFEPDDISPEYIPWVSLLCLGLHSLCLYWVDNTAFQHVTQASMSSWLQEQVADISRSIRSTFPVFSRVLPPRVNPIALVGILATAVTLATYYLIDPGAEGGTFPDTIAGVAISLLLFSTMVPMAVYCGKILLQTTPSHLVGALDKALREAATLEGVLELRNEHFWTVGFGTLVGSLYARVRRDANEQVVLAHITKRLHPFVKHLTVQVRSYLGTEALVTHALDGRQGEALDARFNRTNPRVSLTAPPEVPSVLGEPIIKDDWGRSAASINLEWPPPAAATYMMQHVAPPPAVQPATTALNTAPHQHHHNHTGTCGSHGH